MENPTPANPQTLVCRDGTSLNGLFYSAPEQPKGCLIIGSALGVPQQFYQRFAQFVSRQGYHCLSFDYRGTGDSISAPLKDIALKDWGEQDIAAAIETAASLTANDTVPLHFIGHSIGGQLLGLADNARRLTSILHVAASQPHWSRLKFPHNLQLISIGHFVLPLVALGKDDFPSSKVGLASLNLPGGVARTWAKWMRNRDYLFSPKFGLDTQGYADLTQPLISWSISDDHMAPYKPVEALVQRFPNTRSEHRIIDAKALGLGSIGHMGFFRKNALSTLGQEVISELNKYSV